MPNNSEFEQTQFLGASIANFSAQLGWNGDATSLTVSLVEDTSTSTKRIWSSYNGNTLQINNGSLTATSDSFSPPEIGSPVYFKFGDFEFSGLLQSWEKKNELNGRYYEVRVVGPTEILNNVQLIIGAYSGWVYGIPNLMNIYGYYEYMFGFGGAGVNEAGMPWYGSTGIGIKTGINVLCNAGGDGNFSNRMKFKSQYYNIDVSGLPITDPAYRMGGNIINLGEAISQLCQDAGFDYYPYLEFGGSLPVIRFKCVSRKQVPSLTALATWVESQTEASTKNHGRELRNEDVVGFLIGGQQERIYTNTFEGSGGTATIWPYWGLDAAGNAIIGNGINDAHTFTIDSRHINCPGVGATYTLSVGELRAAAAGIDSWMTYISIVYPSKANTLGVFSRINLDQEIIQGLINGKGNAATIAATTSAVSHFAKDGAEQEAIFNLFTAVEILAKEYYGRKFMVRLNQLPALEPFAWNTEPDTFRELINYEPIDAGYLDVGPWAGGSKPLNFPAMYEDFMTTEDGKWLSFVKFNNAHQLECKNLSPDDFVVYNEGDLKLYVKAQVEPKLVYLNAINHYDPRVVITLPAPINMRIGGSDELWGPAQIILKAIIKGSNGNPETSSGTSEQKTQALSIVNQNGTNAASYFSIDFAPAAVLPMYACVPLRDNNRTYGPWYGTAGAAALAGGKVRVEQNTELVPWNYNGYTWMNYAGMAQMAGVTTNQQEAEMGRVELVGAPTVKLGDVLVEGGPNVTSVDVSIGPNGVSTSYTLRTYTAVVSAFAKARADRYQRLSKVARESYRNNLQNARSINSVPAGYFSARADVFSKKGTAGSVQKSPHLVAYGSIYSHPSFEDSSHKGITVSFGTMEEGVASLNSTTYTKQAICGLDSLFAPFSYYTSASELPHYETPIYAGGIDENKCKSSKYFDPFSHSLHGGSQSPLADGQLYAYGNDVPANGLQTIKNQVSSLNQDIRAIGLKGPITITGWGYDFYGCPVPNADAQTPSLPTLPNRTTFADDFLQKPDKWKSGPLNIRWNPIIKMWDSPYILMKGTYDGKEGDIHMFKYQDIKFPLHDFYNLDDIPVGTKMVCGFMDDELTVISAEC